MLIAPPLGLNFTALSISAPIACVRPSRSADTSGQIGRQIEPEDEAESCRVRAHHRQHRIDQSRHIHRLKSRFDQFQFLQEENVVDQPHDGVGVVDDGLHRAVEVHALQCAQAQEMTITLNRRQGCAQLVRNHGEEIAFALHGLLQRQIGLRQLFILLAQIINRAAVGIAQARRYGAHDRHRHFRIAQQEFLKVVLVYHEQRGFFKRVHTGHARRVFHQRQFAEEVARRAVRSADAACRAAAAC